MCIIPRATISFRLHYADRGMVGRDAANAHDSQSMSSLLRRASVGVADFQCTTHPSRLSPPSFADPTCIFLHGCRHDRPDYHISSIAHRHIVLSQRSRTMAALAGRQAGRGRQGAWLCGWLVGQAEGQAGRPAGRPR